jgi:hypothetical protein
MLDEIRKEREAMDAVIPAWDAGDYDDIAESLARCKLEVMFGGDAA